MCIHGALMAFVVGLLALVTGEKNSEKIYILESGKFLLMESGILEIALVETRILGFGIWNIAQGIWIPLSTGFWNQRSTDKKPRIQYLESGIWNLRCGIQRPRLNLILLHGAT